MKLWKPGLVAAALAAGSMAMAVPAEAHGRRGDDTAVASGAGVLGLAVGAAIASDRNSDVYVRYDNRPRYYGGGYYYRSYPAWRGYDPRYEEWRRWREHERWEDHERREDHERWEHRGWGYRGGWRGW